MNLPIDALNQLESNQKSFYEVRASENQPLSPDREVLLLPGSFNPFHQAHREMARVAVDQTRLPLWFEISVSNAEKGTIDRTELQSRLKRIVDDTQAASFGVVCTNVPTFVDKGNVFPGCTFVVGADTIERISQARFYDSPSAMNDAIHLLAERNCRFLVFGRSIHSTFRTVDVRISETLRELCRFVPREAFENSISSTQSRQENEPGQ